MTRSVCVCTGQLVYVYVHGGLLRQNTSTLFPSSDHSTLIAQTDGKHLVSNCDNASRFFCAQGVSGFRNGHVYTVGTELVCVFLGVINLLQVHWESATLGKLQTRPIGYYTHTQSQLLLQYWGLVRTDCISAKVWRVCWHANAHVQYAHVLVCACMPCFVCVVNNIRHFFVLTLFAASAKWGTICRQP